MKLIVGLGNPGEKYENTRHNIGFMVMEQFFKNYEPVGKTVWDNQEKLKSDIAQIDWQPKHGAGQKILLAKPKTFMNNSGLALSLVASYYKIPAADIWVIHDDIDLPLGKIKIRTGGGSAGHRGIESIMQALGTDGFVRFRLGIGKPFRGKGNSKVKHRRDFEKVDEYVLSSFGPGEAKARRELVKKSIKALNVALENGLESAMNRFNAK